MSGWPGDLNQKQMAALNELREKVKGADLLEEEDLLSDYYMTRWLRARDFNVKRAEEMLRANLIWRKEWNIDEIREYKLPEVLEKYFPGGYCGVDRSGSPIYWEPTGKSDGKGLLSSAKKNDILRKKFQSIETSVYEMKHGKYAQMAGKEVHQIIAVFDLEGLGMKHLWKPGIDLTMEILKCFDLYYPERVKKIFVINAPRMFPLAYKLVRPVLSEATVKKIRVFSGNFYEALLESIDEDNILAHYGGKLKDSNGDPKCSEWICWAGPVPNHYYRECTVTSEHLRHAQVPARKALRLVYEAKRAGAVLRYEFMSEDHDIAFGVYHQLDTAKNSEKLVLVKTRRINCHMVPEDGTLDLPEPGIYVVVFDNKYSWMRSKKVSYAISVVEPLEHGVAEAEQLEGEKEALFDEVVPSEQSADN